MTPEQVRQNALQVEYAVKAGDLSTAKAYLTTLIDELLRHLGAPRVPTKISKARLAEIEAALRANSELAIVDEWNRVYIRDGGMYWREFVVLIDGHWQGMYEGPHPTLRAAMEAPVVRRAGCPPVIEFEVES